MNYICNSLDIIPCIYIYALNLFHLITVMQINYKRLNILIPIDNDYWCSLSPLTVDRDTFIKAKTVWETIRSATHESPKKQIILTTLWRQKVTNNSCAGIAIGIAKYVSLKRGYLFPYNVVRDSNNVVEAHF